MKDGNKLVKGSLVDVLLDKNNTAPIYFTAADGRMIKFDQIAVIPQQDNLYCLLKPIDKIDGVGDDQVIVFRVDVNSDGNEYIVPEDNEARVLRVYNVYRKLFNE